MMKEAFDQEHLQAENGHLLLDCVTGIQTIGLQKGSSKRMISSHVTHHWKFLYRHNMIEHQGKIHTLLQNSYLINPHLQTTNGFQVGLVVVVVLIIKGKGVPCLNTEIGMVIYPWKGHFIKIEHQLKFHTENQHLPLHP
jgi:hypothetical protein